MVPKAAIILSRWRPTMSAVHLSRLAGSSCSMYGMKVSAGLNSAPKSGMRPLKTLAQFNGEFSAKVRTITTPINEMTTNPTKIFSRSSNRATPLVPAP